MTRPHFVSLIHKPVQFENKLFLLYKNLKPLFVVSISHFSPFLKAPFLLFLWLSFEASYFQTGSVRLELFDKMDGLSRTSGAEQACPPPSRLLNFVSNDTQWFSNNISRGSEENKLELTLAPPGEKWSSKNTTCNQGREPWPSSAKFLQFPVNDAAAAVGKESLHSTKMAETSRNNDDAAAAAVVKNGFLPSVSANTAVPQKRTAPGPVVGWPPIRSFRKNLAASTSTKPSPEAESLNDEKRGKKATETTQAKGLFVKINMDGIPIGRKVDLNAYDSYEKLSSAVDNLFRGLLAAQTDSFVNGNLEVGKPITGLLDGSGEYTLVYEDNEGDRILVGDVPWRMFLSTVKRLRVLKTSELPSLSLGGKMQKMQPR